ncbi:FAD-dependent oxidoreductase [Streptomyces sp. NPDC005355]|uniref:phytoene desaturase family protein n=1 Tax=Streptomyces sp. NPDC005355 TaxID=3157038 RepID=UPI00339EED76
MAEADAVVVGSGVNGLVAAAELALAGWSVVLVERNHDIGGFIATEERTHSAGELDTAQGWTPALARGYADRVLNRIARHAPDLHDKILAVDVITPPQLTLHNPNAVDGDPYGGSHELDQSFLWRPLPHSGRHATTVRGLWHIGASTHPGAGLGGVSGHIVASALTRRSRFARVARFSPKR